MNSYSDLSFEGVKKPDNSTYADGNDIRVVNLGPIALLCPYKLTTNSGKHSEEISLAHIVFLMYKRTNSSFELSIGSDRDRKMRQ